jgi:hypothetical protein
MSSKIRDQNSLHFPTGFSAKSRAKQENILQDLVQNPGAKQEGILCSLEGFRT